MVTVVDVIDQVPAWDGYSFDPGAMIRSVNYLRSKAKPLVLSGLWQYRTRISESPASGMLNSTKIPLLLRILFMLPEGVSFPPIHVGQPDDVLAPPYQSWPLYPLVLLKDVPLLIVPSFTLAGDPEDPSVHIEFFSKYGYLRRSPLRPPNDPLGLADDLLVSDAWHRPKGLRDRDRAILRAQLLRLVRPGYDPSGTDRPISAQLHEETIWTLRRREFAQRQVVWNERSDRYEAQRW